MAGASYQLEMQYAGAEWMARAFKHKSMSPLGVAVAECLGFVWRGIYHLPHSTLERPNWSDPHYIRVVVPSVLATFDGPELTALVVVAHDMMLRVEIDGATVRYLGLGFSQRVAREGSMFERMPTIDDQIAALRKCYAVVPQETEAKSA